MSWSIPPGEVLRVLAVLILFRPPHLNDIYAQDTNRATSPQGRLYRQLFTSTPTLFNIYYLQRIIPLIVITSIGIHGDVPQHRTNCGPRALARTLFGVREQLRIVGIKPPSSFCMDGDDVTTSPCVKSVTVVISFGIDCHDCDYTQSSPLQRMKRVYRRLKLCT